MSLVFDKGKYNKYHSNLEQLKLKNNNNTNIYKNNSKKNSGKNNQLYNEYMASSPIRNINNNKKSTFLTTYQNYSNIASNNKTENKNNLNNLNNKKNVNSKKLKYNKSFEGKFLNSDLIFSNDFENDDLYTIRNGKTRGNKKFNNSVILNNNNKQNRIKNKKKHNNKSVTTTINTHMHKKKKNNIDENLLIKKLDEKFKSLENNIIDKKYENDIDHDEMIISTNKKNISFPNTNMNNEKITNKNKLSNIIDDINNKKKVYNNSDDNIERLFINIFSNKNDNYDENYLLNTSFENNRNDFNIMYTDNYEESVMNDMLSLEIKLLIEKMLEIQKSYHKELNIIISQYNSNGKIFKVLIEKIKILQKKIYLIKKLQETKNIKSNTYNFIGIYNHKNQNEINKINKNEFILWKNLTHQQDIRYNEINIGKLKDLFKKIIFDNYYNLSDKLNNIENKIIINLMKKYKYKIGKKNNEIMSNGSNGSISTSINNGKKKVFTASPIQQHKNIIKQNKNGNGNGNGNEKKKHKKTTSCNPVKWTKYNVFKNTKQK